VAVEKHFEDFHEDQFDFHAYCIRKSTFRAYRDFLKWEDKVWAHELYCNASEAIVGIYLHLNDHPTTENGDEPEELASMSAVDRKKAKAMARKKKKKEDASEKKDNLVTQDSKIAGSVTATKTNLVEIDVEGLELLNRNPLDEAKQFVATLVKYAPHRIATWILQYDIAARRGRWLMALQALFKAHAINPFDGELFSRLVDFLNRQPMLNSFDGEPTNDPVGEIVKKGVERLLGGKIVSFEEFIAAKVESIIATNCTPLSARLSISKSCYDSRIWNPIKACSFLLSTTVDGHGASVDILRNSVCFLQELGDEVRDNLEQWKSKIRERFPLSKDPIFSATM